MNAMNGGEFPEGEEPEIILIGMNRSEYFMLKGDDFLSQVLLVDGEYPKPILCVHFESVFDAKMSMGEGFSIAGLWGVNPAIVERLRNTDCLIEKDG